MFRVQYLDGHGWEVQSIKLGGGTGAENELSFYGVRVTSVENITSIDKCMDFNGKYFLCIPRILLKNTCKISDEDKENFGKLRVELVKFKTNF